MLPALVVDAPISSNACKNILNDASALMERDVNRDRQQKKLSVVETIEMYFLSMTLTGGGMLLPIVSFLTYLICCRGWLRSSDFQENSIQTKSLSKFESIISNDVIRIVCKKGVCDCLFKTIWISVF